MRYLKRLEAWGDRKLEAYYHRPFFQSFLSVLITLLFAAIFARALDIFVRFHTLLTPRRQVHYAALIVLVVGVWLGAYMQQRRMRRLVMERDIKEDRLLKEVAHSSFALIVLASVVVLLSLQVIAYLFRCLSSN